MHDERPGLIQVQPRRFLFAKGKLHFPFLSATLRRSPTALVRRHFLNHSMKSKIQYDTFSII